MNEAARLVCDVPDIAAVVRCFDQNAASRDAELRMNADSAHVSIRERIVDLLREFVNGSPAVLDAGCGVGGLMSYVKSCGYPVVGVDPSYRSVKLARARNPESLIHAITLERYARHRTTRTFSCVIASQVLQCVPNLTGFLDATSRLLPLGGVLVVSLPEPTTYLAGREDVAECVDGAERAYRIRFRIRGRDYHPSPYWYFQREWRTYVNALAAAGFDIERAVTPERVGVGRRHDTTFAVCRKVA